jgi:predicted MPP superfamily phosphohydrolase
MNLTGMIMAVAAPRVLLVLLHYTGRFARMKRGGYPRWLTSSGFIISSLIFAVFASSYAFGRYNFKTETVEVRIKGLDHRLEGLRIVQISDLHLAAFNNHYRQLQKAVDIVNGLRPDLILNTGDFISYGWKEFDRCDTILVRATSRYGNFAVLGNHDMGTYFPNATEEYKDINVAKMTELISASGYRLLDNENILLDINGAEIALIGVETEGRYPGIIHTDIEEAARGTDTARLRILLIHDPNQWRADVCGSTGIEITLAGHTHGLQAGIITRKIRWSPAKYIYPEWHGLFTEGRQQLYVNRGLGYIGFPFRIWMPPEITLLILAGT